MNLLLNVCIKLTSLLCYLLGRPASRWLFGLLGILWFDILRIRRQDILNHIGIAFPNLNESEKIKLARKSMRITTANAADLFLMPYINQKWVAENAVYEGSEHVEEALKLGKGILLLGMHVGSGDLAGNLIAMKNWKIHLITKFFKNQSVNKIWFALRGYHGIQHIEPHGEKTPFQILKALKANGLVVFVSDQFMGKPYGIETTFFGRRTGSAQGLAVFHLKTKAPVIPIYCYEGTDGKFHVVFEPPLHTAELISDNKDTSILKLTQLFCNVTEAVIRKHPEHWMWLHRRWKKFE
jgi:Kdo2-lipid IVA lauroyltransferase/acyltransferase